MALDDEASEENLFCEKHLKPEVTEVTELSIRNIVIISGLSDYQKDNF